MKCPCCGYEEVENAKREDKFIVISTSIPGRSGSFEISNHIGITGSGNLYACPKCMCVQLDNRYKK